MVTVDVDGSLAYASIGRGNSPGSIDGHRAIECENTHLILTEETDTA